MLDTKETLILFGRSPYINKIRDKIPALIEKYTTMGCNYFCESYPEVDYVIFYDNLAPNVKDSTIVTQAKYFLDKKFNAAQKYPDYPKKELYTVIKNSDVFAETKGVLHFHFHTPSMALNWAWRKGFKNVVLVGIDLKNHTPHFDMDTTPDIDYPKWYDHDLEKAKRHIKEVAGRYLNIFQLNPESDMEVEKITIDELLSDKLIVKKKERVKDMANVTIKLLSSVLINGQIAKPDDMNNGIYTVTSQEANDLILRKRAVKYEGIIYPTAKENADELKKLKEIATNLGVKFNPNIGAVKLEAKVRVELNAKAEKIGLSYEENIPLEEAYALFVEKEAELNGQGGEESGSGQGDDDNKLSVEELKEIAKAAEIEIAEDTADEDLQEFVEVELENYAQELGLEVGEDDNAKTLWVKIQEKLTEQNG